MDLLVAAWLETPYANPSSAAGSVCISLFYKKVSRFGFEVGPTPVWAHLNLPNHNCNTPIYK